MACWACTTARFVAVLLLGGFCSSQGQQQQENFREIAAPVGGLNLLKPTPGYNYVQANPNVANSGVFDPAEQPQFPPFPGYQTLPKPGSEVLNANVLPNGTIGSGGGLPSKPQPGVFPLFPSENNQSIPVSALTTEGPLLGQSMPTATSGDDLGVDSDGQAPGSSGSSPSDSNFQTGLPNPGDDGNLPSDSGFSNGQPASPSSMVDGNFPSGPTSSGGQDNLGDGNFPSDSGFSNAQPASPSSMVNGNFPSGSPLQWARPPSSSGVGFLPSPFGFPGSNQMLQNSPSGSSNVQSPPFTIPGVPFQRPGMLGGFNNRPWSPPQGIQNILQQVNRPWSVNLG